MPISGPISGSGGLTIGDGGAELSSLSSNYTGITTVNGLLRLSENVPASGIGPLGASTSAVVLVGAGAEIFNSGVQGIFARDLLVKSVGATDHSAVATITNMNITGDVQLDQWVRATGTIAGDVSGPGGINIAATAGLLRLSGNNTFTGGIEVGAGRLNIAGDNATGTGVIYLGGTRGGSTAGRLAAIDAPRTISNRVVVTGPINFNVGTFPLTMAGEFDLNGNLGTTSNYSIVGPPGSASDRIPTISGSVVNGVLFLNGGWLRLTGDNRQGATRVSGNTTLLRVESDHGLGSAPHSTTLAGGTLQLSGGISIPSHPLNLSGRLQSVAGNNTWNGNVNLTGTGLIQVDADTLTIGGSVSSTGSQLLTAGVGTLVAANYRLGSMFSVIAGMARVAPNGTDSGTSKVTALSIDSNARLDLTDNDLVIDYGVSSPAATVRQMLQDGRLFSSLADSTFRLGYRDNNIPANIVSTFSGLPVDASSLLIKYTYAGDTNLDGAVDVTDLGNLATGWNHASLWYTGDFNYDGITNVADLKLLAANWQLGAPASALGLSLDTLLAAFSLPPVEVPEPGALAAVGLVFAAFAGRRRFRSASPARGNQ
jgi:autotransporter-associated beta strand protein